MTTIFLITGFLGAGKTTFLKERLLHAPVKTGVLVNDFGKVNFDGLQIKRQGMDLIELSNGSIFCSCLKDNFIEGLVELVERSLDEIYIESSGLADPSDMGKVLDSVQLRLTHGNFTFGGSICLVDALFFPKVLPKMVSVERQLRHSHLIVINKCDLVSEDQLTQVEQTIAGLNSQANILRTTYGQIDWDSLKLDVFAIADEESTNRIETRNKNLVLQLIYEPDEAVFRAFLSAIGSHFFRVKGLIRLGGQIQKVDQVNSQIQIEPYRQETGDTPPAALQEIDRLVCLTSQGLESISHLARMADQYLPGHFKLEM
ncbi:MAG: hypothetical protein EOM08_06960 [Clostridia bacterium]|nr:hypothetical protein [Clostridia bacterium]